MYNGNIFEHYWHGSQLLIYYGLIIQAWISDNKVWNSGVGKTTPIYH